MPTASTPPIQTSTPGSGSGQVSYPSLPASPTLTNPDMILPDYEDACSSPDRSQSPRTMWKNIHGADMSFDLTTQVFTGPITPTTPIIYGNGTMLSDIGEVTEVESTCAPTKPRSGSMQSDASMQLVSVARYEALKRKDGKATRERRESIDSTSTITTHEQGALFTDFDDSVSIDDSNFQGDDEESVADSFVDDALAHDDATQTRDRRTPTGEERYSTALSRRAEQILANAKRRLNTMEGNLNRARTTLYSPTWSSVGSDSTPSPTIGRPGTAIHHDHDANHRQSVYGHARISSESNIQIDVAKSSTTHTPRSSSALGAAGGYRQPLSTSRSADYVREGAKETRIHESITSPRMLEPLSEDYTSQGVNSARASLEGTRLDGFLSPPLGSYSDQGLRRSVSTAQMRDLKDHMKDLKGRLSTLRDQARQDSLKRRSLQSLRTPSPFTHARIDQWYADAARYEDNASIHEDYKSQPSIGDVASTNEGEEGSAAKEAITEEDRELASVGLFDVDGTIPPGSLGPVENGSRPPQVATPVITRDTEDDMDDMKTEDGYDDEDTEENEEVELTDGERSVVDDGASESGASSYYDTVQNQVSHEDREDAFDYEHFFLHSAMGSMSQSRMKRASRTSFSSEDSVETTRGPTPSANAKAVGRPSRKGSFASVSSVDSFATATEGRSTRAENEFVEYYEEHGVIVPKRARTHTPNTSRRAGFSNEASDSGSDQSRPGALGIRRPQSSAATFMHRPSVSSLDSSRTHRSFLSANRGQANGSTLSPLGSANPGLGKIAEALLGESFRIEDGNSKISPIQKLQKDDQILVERLFGSIGQSIIGLAESGRGSTEYRSYRRRLEAARRVLDSLEDQISPRNL
ncbi:hypothetical protein GGS23DRAFT_83908 [Durotheca rogersii]|uniref:uncharacterized protein n=1 Tax=Durotheca rogersii TaxID=419775 RepID=UPI00221F71A3|nr:uncharacterized protein GGS23DRAFT_83908 [Durotheca rogersii]KAI5862600.1 hypothetical protein GGS23DRAFT_83908 [Durotheca rogersii]